MSSTSITVTHGKRSRGFYPLSVQSDGDVIYAGKADPNREETVTAFIGGLCAQRPGLNGAVEQIRQQILQLAKIKRITSDQLNGRVLDPTDPVDTARKFWKWRYSHPDAPTLRSDGAEAYAWEAARYVLRNAATIRSEVYGYLEAARKLVQRGDNEELVPFKPTTSTVNQVIDALHAVAHVEHRAPCWLSTDMSLPDPRRIISAANGLVSVDSDGNAVLFRGPTPLFFTHTALDFAFDASAPEPFNWLLFLDILWPDDSESIELLQQWFGYVLLGDTRFQKILMLVGPKRGGKGTIARILTRMIGRDNVCGPTLSGLASHFGLWSLIDKRLGIIADARLGNRTDQAIVTERLLSITGEDGIDIDRKNLAPLKAVKLDTRLMMLTNELPRLSDSSGAIASRFLILALTQSFYGKEDVGREERLSKELPGILLWAIKGWRKLMTAGRFTEPKTSKQIIEDLNDLSSPISAFVRDWCIVKPGTKVVGKELFEAWGVWCKQQGRDSHGTIQLFGRDLCAACTGVSSKQWRNPDEDGKQVRGYQGITLTEVAKHEVALSRDVTRD